MPTRPTSPEGIPPRTPRSWLILLPRSFQSRSSPTPSLGSRGPPPPRWAPLTCGSARGRWALAGPGSGPGSGRAGALLACGRAPCPRGPGRVARRGCPCTGSPGGPWAPPGGASGLQTASRGAGGGGGGGGEAETGARPSDQGPGSRRGKPRLSHPKPPAGDPDAASASEGWEGQGRRNRAAWRRGLCVSPQEAN